MMEARRLKKAVMIGCALVATGLAAQNAEAVERTYWVLPPPAAGYWFEPTNWDNGVPSLAGVAYIDNGGTAQIAGGAPEAYSVCVGWVGTGNVVQTAGNSYVKYTLYLASAVNSEGYYELSGGNLSCRRACIGYPGDGHFKQTGGEHTVREFSMVLGGNAPMAYGLYELEGSGKLTVAGMSLGSEGLGVFQQRGGTHIIEGKLWMGCALFAEGIYELSGGALTVEGVTTVGDKGAGTFRQSGGIANLAFFEVRPGSTCEVTGGTFQVNNGGVIQGLWDLTGGTGLVKHKSGILDVTAAEIRSPSGTSYRGYNGALLIHPADFNPPARFGSFQTDGLTHVQGETLTIPSTKKVIGRGTIIGHVDNAGTIDRGVWFTGINIRGGLFVRDGGTANLGSQRDLVIDDEMSGLANGKIDVGHVVVGDQGTGRFVQTAGNFRQWYDLVLGAHPGSKGTYELRGGTMDGRDITVGAGGEGHFFHTAGDIPGLYSLRVGGDAGTSSVYELGGTGTLKSDITRLSGKGAPRFIQTGGVHSGYSLILAGNSTYELRGGLLGKGVSIEVQSGSLIQTGGRLSSRRLYVGGSPHREVTYTLSQGDVSLKEALVGYRHAGHLIQTGGTVVLTERLCVGYDPFAERASGLYEFKGGNLAVDSLILGLDRYAYGEFVQTGGRVDVAKDIMLTSGKSTTAVCRVAGGTLNVGGDVRFGLGAGTFVLDGGSLVTGHLSVRSYSSAGGILNFNSPAAYVEVAQTLRFGQNGKITAVPGAKIHMTGAAFENESTDPAALAGLRNLELIFEGGPADMDPFEVACEDRGRSWDGFQENFALGGLTLGGADIGQVRLVDHFDNQPAWEGSEALYVEDLFLSADSYLDLNGLNLYYLRLKDLGGTVETDGGHLTQIPVDVGVDVKPGSCPNPLNVKGRGVLPVAVLGTEEFDVMTIDPSSIFLGREGIEDGLAPLRWAYEDVAAPFEGDPGDCHDLDDDGYLDLTLKFKTQDLVELLALGDEAGGLIHLTLTGSQTEEGGGYGIEGTDCVWVLVPGDADGDLDVDATDLASLGMNWAPSGTDKVWLDADFDGDGDVDATDLASLGMNWSPGGYVGGAGAGTVPEPVSLSVMGVGLIGIALRKSMKRTA